MRRPSRVVGLLVLLLAVGAGAFVLAAHRRADFVVARHGARVAAAARAARAAALERPSPFGAFRPGGAWEEYHAGVRALSSIGSDALRGTVHDEDTDTSRPLSAERAAAVGAAVDQALARLREGLSRRLDLPDYAYADAALAGRFQDEVRWDGFLLTLQIVLERFRTAGRHDDLLEASVVTIGVAQDAERATPQAVGLRLALHAVDHELRRALDGHAMSAGALEGFLRRLAILERGARPEDEALRIEELLDTLNVEATRDGRRGPVEAPEVVPTWRTLYSRRIAHAARLQRMEELYAALRSPFRSPPWTRIDAAGRLPQWNTTWTDRLFPGACGLGRGHPEVGRQTSGVEILNHWAAMKIAAALALHEVRTGRFPDRLEELAPAILPSVPPCPLTGAPYPYAPGILTIPDTSGRRVVPVARIRRR
jgi:hypothetical protein